MEKFKKHIDQLSDAQEYASMETREKGDVSAYKLVETIESDDPAIRDFDKEVAFCRLVGKVKPGFLDPTRMYDAGKLPIDPKNYEFKPMIGMGGESKVYPIMSKSPELPSWIMKIYRKEKGSTSELVEQGKKIKEEYEKIKDWYKAIPDAVPQEHMIIADDPKVHEPRLIILREFISEEIIDIFEDISEYQLCELLKRDHKLRNAYQKFCEITLLHEQQSHEMIDVLGKKNISLLRNGDRYKFIILDPHIIYSTKTSRKDRIERLKRHLNFMIEMAEDTSGKEGVVNEPLGLGD